MKKFLKGLALTILILILFITTSSLLFLLPMKNAFNKNSIKDMISNIEVEKMVTEYPEFQQVVEDVFEPIYEGTKELGISEDVVMKIIDSKEVKDLIGNVTSNIIDYAVTGENQKIISTDNIEELLNQAIDDINASGYYEFKPEDKENILNTVSEKVNEYQDLIPDTSVIGDNLNEENKQALDIFRFILGNELTLYIIITMLVSILGIIALNWKGAKCIKDIASTVLTSAILSIIFTAIILFGGKTILAEYSYVFDIIRKPINFSFTLSISVLVITIIVLIVYGIIKKKTTKPLEEKNA